MKRTIAGRSARFCPEPGWSFVREPAGAESNYWVNSIVLDSSAERDEFLRYTNDQSEMTRPIWRLMNRLEMFRTCQHDG